MSEARWLLIGADQRMKECAQFLQQEKLEVTVHPHDEATRSLTDKITETKPTHVVLPIQGLKGFLTAKNFAPGTLFFAGILKEAQQIDLEMAGHRVLCYLEDERFVWKNARLTAEGFIKEYYQETTMPIEGTHFQIAGFGRVGKMVAYALAALKADVTVYARSEAQLGEAAATGFEVKKLTSDVQFETGYLVNTIPAQWLSLQSDDQLRIFDLASKPGCLKHGTSSAYYTLHLGLPGKHFPQQAANYLAETLLRMCRGKE